MVAADARFRVRARESMTRAQLLRFHASLPGGGQTSVSASGAPQAAIVGVAIGDDFEVVFDTLQTSRKAQNLRQSPKVALVVGGWGQGEEQTVQYEGVADEPGGSELDRIRELYFGVYPDGRERLANSPGSFTSGCGQLGFATATSVSVPRSYSSSRQASWLRCVE